MKRILLLAGLLAIVGCSTEKNTEIQRSVVFSQDSDSCHFYRIPAMTLDKDGNIIAVADRRYENSADVGYRDSKIDIGMKRSTDGGKTWGDQKIIAYGGGDPSLTLTKTGRIICVTADSNNPRIGFRRGLKRTLVTTSDDGGLTWSELKPFPFPDWVFSAFITSGKGIYDNDGDILLAADVLVQDYPDPMPDPWPIEVHLFYSKDDGETWALQQEVAYDLADESKLVMLPDGRLLMSSRRGKYGERGLNTAVKGDDGIWHWDVQRTTENLVANPCNGDIISYKDGVLLHSYIKEEKMRKGLTLAVSRDDGTSWEDILTLQSGRAAYSTMVRFKNGDVGMLYEDGTINEDGGYDIIFLRIPRKLIRRLL